MDRDRKKELLTQAADPETVSEAKWLFQHRHNFLPQSARQSTADAHEFIESHYGDSEEVEDDGDEDNDNDYSDMKVPQLRDELEDRGLIKSGRKKELVSRLERDDAGELENDDLTDNDADEDDIEF